jgi:hypothetical protein
MGEQEDELAVEQLNLLLKFDGEALDGMSKLPLARLQRNAQGRFEQDAGFIRPCCAAVPHPCCNSACNCWPTCCWPGSTACSSNAVNAPGKPPTICCPTSACCG